MKRTARFCYRKIIDASSSKAWERLVLEDSFSEFKMQAQRFNEGNRFTRFAEILQNNPGAEQLHFLTSAAVTGYIKMLNGKIPDIQNTLGKTFLPFKNFRFEIIHSDIKDISKHTVAINFYSEPLLWMDTIGNVLVIALQDKTENGEMLTETFTLSPFVSIYSIKETAA